MSASRFRTLTAAGLVVLGAVTTGLVGAPPAAAGVLDSGHFVDLIDDLFDCNGTPTHQTGEVAVAFTVVRRGQSGAPYFRESVHGSLAFTNLDTGGSYSNTFTANFRDLRITDNGDGTITIVSQGSGQSSWYDKDGALVLKDTGVFRSSVDIDLNGTPENPDDDTEVDGSFELTVPRTGRDDTTDRDFCTDLRLFT